MLVDPLVDCTINTGKNYFNKVNKKNGKYFKGKVDASPFCVFKSVGQFFCAQSI